MNSFEQIGEARLLAYEGQRQIAAALAALIKRAFQDIFSTSARPSRG